MKTKTYYLHVSYKGIADYGDTVLGDMLVKTPNCSLNEIREWIKNNSKLERLPAIISLSELSKGLYEMLLDKTEDNEQHQGTDTPKD